MRRQIIGALPLLLSLLLAAPAASQPLTFDSSTVGGPLSNMHAELYVPKGQGPFAAVVILHGCDGIGPHYRVWARRLAEWGYMALLVDSFRPRGVVTTCNRGMLVPPDWRAQDAFNAAGYLRTLADVRADRIGLIGFSHGGWSTLHAVAAHPQDKPFVAAVAFYPWCFPPPAALNTDTLVLIGDADDWTPADRCLAMRDQINTGGREFRLKVYPGALHGFDVPLPPRVYAGHKVGGDPAAAADAIAETRAFLAARLLSPP